MSRFDLLASRLAGTPVSEQFGQLLLDELKLPPSEVAALLQQGWARIPLGVEEAVAGAVRSRLASVGVSVQLIDTDRPTPPRGLELLGVTGDPVEEPIPVGGLRPDVERMVAEEVMAPIALETAEPRSRSR